MIMNRRSFTKTCIGCLASATLPSMLMSCQSTHYATGTIENDGISVLKSEFDIAKKNKPEIRKYIIVRNDSFEFPFYVYRFSENDFSAVLMKCTHQGNELQASGDHLHCSAHGSEYDSKGLVTQGPAEANLRSFKVSSYNDRIFIDLRA